MSRMPCRTPHSPSPGPALSCPTSIVWPVVPAFLVLLTVNHCLSVLDDDYFVPYHSPTVRPLEMLERLAPQKSTLILKDHLLVIIIRLRGRLEIWPTFEDHLCSAIPFRYI